ncbi:MAG: molybdopterin-guanine dinucleotide biosynthesis protein B [Aestuariivita sp.]|nr:molybdopterin-guanine dinucleotide biosynthesis protein B [Aestuariivita sp.]MCY4203658.1 molybdopterin-guanine dinucleotide biosynthesis protein B [Aestuariivita sp.]MCY4287133.1 molybdopterin-guanine dinucleotide biosynthesis protein B [Aestuariivita sp.]MCY4345448.1 molybdopterin-guanine dinucleotide biosynthesis protein B [Aestuariivita sp.]
MKTFGIVGWKNSGKTDLIERLLKELINRGHLVSTIKHAHHNFDVDHAGTDSYRHRTAGAKEVFISSRQRFALMHELYDEIELTLDEILPRLAPVDLVLVEGYKRERHQKIEVHRAGTKGELMAPHDPTICAIASDVKLTTDDQLLDLNDTPTIADFISRKVGL